MSTAPQAESKAEVLEDRITLRHEDFGIVFRRSGDRWTETILGDGPAVELTRSRAVDGDDRTRIAHPVYQEAQLHGATRGDSVCLLLTGLCFDHHFSAAVTLSPDPAERSALLLDFDIADRCRSRVERLAATYVVGLDSGALESADPGRIAWRVTSPTPARLELVAGPGASLAMAEAGRQAASVQVLASIQPGTFTQRLRYGWRWTIAGPETR